MSSELRPFLAVYGHYVEVESGETRDVLLALRRLQGPHSGENKAACVWQVAAEYGITRKLGHFTVVNSAPSCNALQHIADKSALIGIPFDPAHLVFCFRDVLEVAGKAVLWSKNTAAISPHLDEDVEPNAQMEALRYWGSGGPVGRLHICIQHILMSPDRRDRFLEDARGYGLDGESLSMIATSGSSWSEDYAAIVQALRLRNPLDDYLACVPYLDQNRDDGIPVPDKLSPQDWDDLRTIIMLMKPFQTWRTYLQQKRTTARLSDVLPAYDELISHLEAEIIVHRPPNGSRCVLFSLTAGWLRLRE